MIYGRFQTKPVTAWHVAQHFEISADRSDNSPCDVSDHGAVSAKSSGRSLRTAAQQQVTSQDFPRIEVGSFWSRDFRVNFISHQFTVLRLFSIPYGLVICRVLASDQWRTKRKRSLNSFGEAVWSLQGVDWTNPAVASLGVFGCPLPCTKVDSADCRLCWSMFDIGYDPSIPVVAFRRCNCCFRLVALW